MQRNKCTSQTVAHILHFLCVQHVLKLASEPVCLPLKVAADRIHADADNSFKRCQDHLHKKSVFLSAPSGGVKTNLEQQKRDDGWGLCRDGFGEIEGTEERRCVKEGREKRENREDVYL
jgi:hypothetical protein